jgi:hypothetical protein
MIHSIAYRSYIVYTQLRCLEAVGALGKWAWKSRRRSFRIVFAYLLFGQLLWPAMCSEEISNSLVTLAMRGLSDREVAPFKI